MLSFTDPAVTVEEAHSYASARGWSDWLSATEHDQSTAILRGQTYLASTYNGRWVMQWANDEAPAAVRYAIIEAARRELRSPGSLSPDYDPAKVVTNKRVKAGPVETQTAFADPKGAQPVVPMIAALLAGLIIAPRSQRVATSFLARA